MRHWFLHNLYQHCMMQGCMRWWSTLAWRSGWLSRGHWQPLTRADAKIRCIRYCINAHACTERSILTVACNLYTQGYRSVHVAAQRALHLHTCNLYCASIGQLQVQRGLHTHTLMTAIHSNRDNPPRSRNLCGYEVVCWHGGLRVTAVSTPAQIQVTHVYNKQNRFKKSSDRDLFVFIDPTCTFWHTAIILERIWRLK